MTVAKHGTTGYGRPIGAVRLAGHAAACGWRARLGPVRRVDGRLVVRLTMVRGQWPAPGSWELQMNWDTPKGGRTFERRPHVFGRRDGGPWSEIGTKISDVIIILDENRVLDRSLIPQPKIREESPGSLRYGDRRNR
jgi:hypothetical protein